MGSKYLLALFIFVLFSGAVSAQIFDSGKDLRKPVKIPAGILSRLKKTGQVKSCLQNGEEKFSASWFRAARINLNNDRLADYVVKNYERLPERPASRQLVDLQRKDLIEGRVREL